MFERLYIALMKQLRPYDRQGAQLWQSHCKLRKEILAYYHDHPSTDPAIVQALDYLKGRLDTVFFPAPFREKYEYRHIYLGFDEDHTPYWDMEEGKRLYFLPDSPDKVRRDLNGLRIEQDEESAHRYLTPSFNLGEDDVLADVGCAEGILTLQHIEKIRHAYLFESDPAWISVLEKTFKPWKEKVTIVKGYVSDKDEGDHLRLDTYFKREGTTPTFVKLDVEGHEMSAINGMEGLLDGGLPMKVAACTYHLQDEYSQLLDYVQKKGYSYETSRGVMLFGLYDTPKPPYFRHGLIRFKNQQA